ncbi:hypothetical protein ERJ75_000193700 [Trypanosoma vivax]|uniref:Uncharacterized protein n=1 Tax=Trypanosoma vivax (strain Y486) TaxID=1055687 RepID=G0UA39_TRYVY|nr:hypothetical protein TRVL_03124 [Trypanosoma vivax]KAH8619054.1 hypothetical protein ERJ75_000193700 [Trypanosoma vivax]CCC52671.1 conserved hypothetical protein [Trypanosoma vivax Y486]
MLRRCLIGGATVVIRLRFDRNAEGRVKGAVRYKPLPESMQPKQVGENFTPFPLPKYDEDLGYGPVRIRNVPDIEAAKERQRCRGVALMEASLYDDSHDEDVLKGEKSIGEQPSNAADPPKDECLAAPPQAPTRLAGEGLLDGYSASSDNPLIDRLQCNRSIGELIAQFEERPEIESRTAAIWDMASTLQHRSDEDLSRMFAAIVSPFSIDGGGLNFLSVKVSKFGRPYFVSSCLTSAYVGLVDAATVMFVQEQPWRLMRSPALFIDLLNFMALIKVFEPNKWFTPTEHAVSNRADYKHPRGTNSLTAFWGTGEELFDFMVELVRPQGDGVAPPDIFGLFTDEQLVDLLNGFSAVMPDGKAIGHVFNSIMGSFLQRVRRRKGEMLAANDLVTMERMYLTSVLSDANCEELLRHLLHETSSPRGPYFFAAVARSRDAILHRKALVLLQESIDDALGREDKPLLQALLESGSEFLLSMRDKGEAYNFAQKNEFDYRILASFEHFQAVAARLRTEAVDIATRIPSSLRNIQEQLIALNSTRTLRPMTPTGSTEDGTPLTTARPFKPMMTVLSQLERLNDMDSVFVLHSSFLSKSADQLISAVRRLSSGKDSLIVTMACLRALSVKSFTSPKRGEREACGRALEIVAYELEKGRVTLLPFSEEVLLHDAGSYCDEDLMLWTVAAYVARELPLVKMYTLIDKNCPACTPYRFLKGGHNLLVSSYSLYDKEAPLLSALYSKELRLVTHNVSLRTPVRDRKSTLYNYNPVRARFVYRRDKALFDKYHVTARNLAPGFSRGGLRHDWRGLGLYTPDHPQLPFRPLSILMQRQSVEEMDAA